MTAAITAVAVFIIAGAMIGATLLRYESLRIWECDQTEYFDPPCRLTVVP